MAVYEYKSALRDVTGFHTTRHIFLVRIYSPKCMCRGLSFSTQILQEELASKLFAFVAGGPEAFSAPVPISEV